MTDGNKIKDKADVNKFSERIREYGRENICCTGHTFFRISEKQRHIFTCESIRDILAKDVPILVGLQNNGCFAVFYKHKNSKFIRIILDMKADRRDVVTFYDIEEKQLPVIK